MGNHVTLQGEPVSDALIASRLGAGSVDDDYTAFYRLAHKGGH